MKKISTLFIMKMLMLVSASSQNLSWQWVQTSFSDYPEYIDSRKVISDAEGNIYVIGHFNKTDIGFGTYAFYNGGGSSPYDSYIIKYNSAGNILWAKHLRGAGFTGLDYITDITFDNAGNLLITGSFGSQSISFGSTTLVSTSVTGEDIFLAKMDTAGNYLWAKRFGGSYVQNAVGVRCDNAGNIYLLGNYNSSFAISSMLLPAPVQYDIFLAKLDSAANRIWVRTARGNTNDFFNDLMVDANANIYVAGYFYSDTIRIGTTLLSNTMGMANMFVAKYDSSGNALWAENLGNGFCSALTTDENNNWYAAGVFYMDTLRYGSSVIPPYDAMSIQNNIFIAKFGSNDSVAWIRTAPGTGVNYGCQPEAIDVNAAGDVFTAGFFSADTLNFGSTVIYNSSSLIGYSTDIFLAKYDAGGNLQWVEQSGGTEIDYANGLCIDNSGYLYLTGSYSSSPMQLGNFSFTTSNEGAPDFFVAKISPDGVGFNELTGENHLLLYPNPVTTQFTVYSSAQFNITNISIHDVLGQKVFYRIENSNTVSPSATVNISGLPAGIYFVTLGNGKKTITEKIIKQ